MLKTEYCTIFVHGISSLLRYIDISFTLLRDVETYVVCRTRSEDMLRTSDGNEQTLASVAKRGNFSSNTSAAAL